MMPDDACHSYERWRRQWFVKCHLKLTPYCHSKMTPLYGARAEARAP